MLPTSKNCDTLEGQTTEATRQKTEVLTYTSQYYEIHRYKIFGTQPEDGSTIKPKYLQKLWSSVGPDDRAVQGVGLKPLNPYPTAFPYGNGMVLHFYQQQESSTTKTVHKVINKGLKTYV